MELPKNKKPFNITRRKSDANTPSDVSPVQGRLYTNERVNPEYKKSDVWIGVALSVLGTATSAEVADLCGYTAEHVKKRLSKRKDWAKPLGHTRNRRWQCLKTFAEITGWYNEYTAPEVDKRRRRILEDRREYHEQKYRYLASNGAFKQARIHFDYAEKYARILEYLDAAS